MTLATFVRTLDLMHPPTQESTSPSSVQWNKWRGPAADAEYSTGVTDIGRRETGGKRGGKIKKE